jgi:cytochrome c-type biogenesis protein CcmE
VSSAVETPIGHIRLLGVSSSLDTAGRWFVVKPKNQRLTLAAVAVASLIGAVLIAGPALRENASYFYTPTTLAEANLPVGKAARLGGMVKSGSIKRDADGATIRFVLQDGKGEQAVSYRGTTPSLFVEGSGAVADGRLASDGTFVADEILAKHDENYVPKELADIDMNAAEHTKDTLAK